MIFNRRNFLAGAAVCGAIPAFAQTEAAQEQLAKEAQQFAPQMVTIGAGYEPYTIHVDPTSFNLFWILPENQAIMYRVGVARANLYEDGIYTIKRKQEWPTWTPTPDMIAREPEVYAKYADGMPGGVDNPLGARALYLYEGNRDTYLRIHGTPDPLTIGREVSNGCVRLINDHVKDLYDRVPTGTKVYLYPRNMA